VALVNSRGFIVEYANDLLELLQKNSANLFQLTDLDASGLAISQQIADIPRIGIDSKTIYDLDLRLKDVEEKYEPYKKHLSSLPTEYKELVKEKRIEIDSVLAEVGPEVFWEYLEARMMELAPSRDFTRSVDLSIVLPVEITEPISNIEKYVKRMGFEEQSELNKLLVTWRRGFVDVSEMESYCRQEIQYSISQYERIQDLAKALHEVEQKYERKYVKSTRQ